MGIESASYISELVITNPVGGADLVSDGDNHLRLIKSVLKTQFPNLGAAAVTPTAAELNLWAGFTIDSNPDMALGGNGSALVWVPGAFKPVATKTAAGDATVEFFHDGIDNAGANFQEGYEYKIELTEVYTSAVDQFLLFQLFESGAYRSGANEYWSFYIQGVAGGSVAASSITQTFGYATGTQNNDSGSNQQRDAFNGFTAFRNLASTSRRSAWRGASHSLGGGSGQQAVLQGRVWTTNEFRAATKLKMYASSGTLSGKFTLLRRRTEP